MVRENCYFFFVELIFGRRENFHKSFFSSQFMKKDQPSIDVRRPFREDDGHGREKYKRKVGGKKRKAV